MSPSRTSRSHQSRLVLAGGGAAAALVLLASPALAHVTVQSTEATQGGYAEISFRVPTEEDTNTVKVEVALPTDTPLALVTVKPHPGWTYTETTAKPSSPLSDDDGPVDSVVTGITWTATAGGIAPGEYDDFDISAGPLPKAASMEFKALQTYADGSVVRWIEETPAGGPEPDHPAPVLRLAAATDDAVATDPTPNTQPSVQAASSSSSSSKGLSIAALAIAVVAALLGGGALLASRTRHTPS